MSAARGRGPAARVGGRATPERRRERGHLLLDYFVGSTVFLIALGSFLAATNERLIGLGEAERRTRAVQAADSELAALRAGRPARATPTRVEGLIGGRVEVTRTTREDLGGLAEVRVTVRWSQPNGPEQSLTLTSVLP